MKKIITVLGARPQFVKAAMVSRAIQNEKQFQEIIIHTGQHYDPNMSDVFFEEMGIPAPAYNLGVSGGGHGEMTGKMMVELESIVIKEKPDLILVYGDTNSTLAGALVARKLNIRLAHVEAGLRNFDMTIPEEVNRIVTDRISDILFCPTQLSVDNLLKEGFGNFDCRVVRTGDLMFDAVIHYSKDVEPVASERGNYVLCTIHRANNTSEPGIYECFKALNSIAKKRKIVFPVHPRTEKALKSHGLSLDPSIEVLPPQGYLDMIRLLRGADCVITDSGGLQKEAYALGKKSLLLMDVTPWQELVDNNFSVTAKTDQKDIADKWEKLQTLSPDFNIRLYGDGNSSREIVDRLKLLLL